MSQNHGLQGLLTDYYASLPSTRFPFLSDLIESAISFCHLLLTFEFFVLALGIVIVHRLWRRSWSLWGVGLLIFFTVQLIVYRPSLTREIESPQVSVLTWNLQSYEGDWEEAFARVQRSDADVLCFQEAQHPELQKALREQIEYEVAFCDKDAFGERELVVCSRFPILSFQTVALHSSRALVVTLEVEGRELRLVNFRQLKWGLNEQLDSSRELLGMSSRQLLDFEGLYQIATRGGVDILAGDWNSPHSRVQSHWYGWGWSRDMDYGVCAPASYPSSWPLWGIDMIWFAKDSLAYGGQESFCWPELSDHSACMAYFQVKGSL